MQGTDNINNTSANGRLIRPDSTVFTLALSKEHPAEHRAFGFEDDLLVPFAKHFSSVCYHDLFLGAKQHGIVIPCPDAPRFANCNILFNDASDPENVNYELYRVFINWWTDVLARSVLTAGIEGGIHLNLAGYSKERVRVVSERYNRLISSNEYVKQLEYDFLKHYASSGKYDHVPHLSFNTKWTNEERELMKSSDEDIYPGFTDWDLAVILRDPLLLSKTTFYSVFSVKELDQLVPLTKQQLKDQFDIQL
jgi:hypothetical protein